MRGFCCGNYYWIRRCKNRLSLRLRVFAVAFFKTTAKARIDTGFLRKGIRGTGSREP